MGFSLFSTSKRDRSAGASSSASEASPAAEVPARPEAGVTRAAVASCLKYVIDPEVGMNIVDLGLVYDLQVDVPRVALRLTMTTPACPMSSHITRQAQTILERIRGVERAEVELVWDPPWSPAMMDPEASLRHFGGRFRR